LFSFVKAITESGDTTPDAILQSHFETTDDAALVIDTHLQVKSVNPAFKRIFGYHPEDILGLSTSILIPSEEDLTEYLQKRRVGSLIANKDAEKLVFVDAHGRRFDGELRGSHVVNNNGKTLGYIAIIRDLRTLSRTPYQTELVDPRLQQAMSAVEDAGWTSDTKTGVTKISPRFSAMLGIPASAGAMMHRIQMLEKIHPDDIMNVRRLTNAVDKGRVSHFDVEFRLLQPNGGYRWVRNKGRVIEHDENGNPTHTSGLLRDIDDRKKLELQASQTDQLFREALIAANQTLWTVDLVSEVVRIEGPLVSLLGKPGESLITTREKFRKFVHPDDLERSMSAWEKVVNTNTEAYVFTGRMFADGGDVIRVSLRARVAERDAQNMPSRATGFIQILDTELQNTRQNDKPASITSEETSPPHLNPDS